MMIFFPPLLIGSIKLGGLDLVGFHVDTEPDVVMVTTSLVEDVLEVGWGRDAGGNALQPGKDGIRDLVRGAHG